MVDRVELQLRKVVSDALLRGVTFEHDASARGFSLADHIACDLVLSLKAAIAAVGKHQVEVGFDVPATWWQATRERFLPARWLRRWPVRTRRLSRAVTVYRAVCPHVGVERDQVHFAFLAESAAMGLEWGDEPTREERPAVQKRGGRYI